MKLSIIVPCFNCSKTIGRLLDSIVNNDLEKDEYEVIIVDDKSTDGFLDIVKTYEDKIKHLRGKIEYAESIANIKVEDKKVFEKDEETRLYWNKEIESGRTYRSMIDIFFDAYFQKFQ